MAHQHYRLRTAADDGQLRSCSHVDTATVHVIRAAILHPQHRHPARCPSITEVLIQTVCGPEEPPIAPPQATIATGPVATSGGGSCHNTLSNPAIVKNSAWRNVSVIITS